MKRTKFACKMQRKPQQPHKKGPQPRIECVYLGDIMRQGAARRRARQAAAAVETMP